MSPLNIVIKKNMKRNRLREAGASPARSRHCKGDCPCTMPLSSAYAQIGWEGAGQDEPKPGDLPVTRKSHCSTQDREVVFCLNQFCSDRFPGPR